MPNTRRRLVGRVISDKMDKTVMVAVETAKMHRLYGKTVRTVKKYMAHDESNEIPVGAMVQIVESRPLSKHKRWAVEMVIQKELARETSHRLIEELEDSDLVTGEEEEAADETQLAQPTAEVVAAAEAEAEAVAEPAAVEAVAEAVAEVEEAAPEPAESGAEDVVEPAAEAEAADEADDAAADAEEED